MEEVFSTEGRELSAGEVTGLRWLGLGRQVIVVSGDGLVGRDADVEGIEEAFRHTRLVTLTGPPGAGKTALARVVAARRGAPA